MKSILHLKKVGWLAMLLTVMASVFPSDVLAENWVDNPFSYVIRQETDGILRFELPVYDQDGNDSWVEKGSMMVSYDTGGGISQSFSFIDWKACAHDINPNDYKTSAEFFRGVDGTFTLVRSENTFYPAADVEIPKNVNCLEDVYRQSDQMQRMCAVVTWKVPRELRGKTLRFSYEVQMKGKTVSIQDKTIDMSAAPSVMKPVITEPMILEEEKYNSRIIVPWMIPVDSSKIKKVTAYYTDVVERYINLETNSSGFALLYPDIAYRNFRVVADYYDSEGYFMQNVSSDSLNISMIHIPENFKATALNDTKASVELSWKINEVGYDDFMDGDVFQIQRSLTGKIEDFVDIGFEMFDLNKENYTYVDSTIIPALYKELIDQTTGEINVSYRIRRGVTSVWGWNQSTVRSVDASKMKNLKLREVASADAHWQNKDENTVRVDWKYTGDEGVAGVTGYNPVWDDRSALSLRVNMYNREGALVDSLVYQLTDSEMESREKIISLPRSCVEYKFYLVTKRGGSPIPYSKSQFITSAEDWELLTSRMNNGETTLDVYLSSDITLPGNFTQLGSPDNYFGGNIYGNGHTITIDADKPLIGGMSHGSVCDLTIDGKYNARCMAPLANEVYNSDIKNVQIRTKFTATGTTDHAEYPFNPVAAFIYKVSEVNYKNCLFAGILAEESDGFQWMGFNVHAKNSNYEYCVSAPQNSTTSRYPFFNPGDYYSSSSPNQGKEYFFTSTYDIHNVADGSQPLPEDVEEQLWRLGADWMAAEPWPGIMPVVSSRLDNDGVAYAANNISDHVNNFYFESSGKVLPQSLVTETRQSSVYLTWESDGGLIDFYQVMRTIKGKDRWTIVADNITEMSYEDTSVSPLETYEYKVRSAVDCEGTHYNETEAVQGECKHTGMIEGVLRYVDGTAISGMKIVVSLDGDDIMSTFTDSKGYYMFEGLQYYDKRSIKYTVAPISDPQTQGNIELETNSYEVTFNGTTNYVKLDDFVVTSGVTFSGYVFYEGTRIPVKGVGFMVNGKQILTASGNNLESDFDGKFSFHVNTGLELEIKPIMPGHTFNSNQVYRHEFTDKVDEFTFYDDTKVKLVGRMVGGSVQGDIPLDNSLSRNNLGDNLKMTISLEGDNSSYIVYDPKNPSKTVRDSEFVHRSHDGKEHKTAMHATRKLIEINPDSETGEYVAYLPPVKWKVQHLSCSGYPTLFPDGKFSDVIDLTDALDLKRDTLYGDWPTLTNNLVIHEAVVEYNAVYNCIYHTPTQLTYKQLGMSKFDYFGDLTYKATNLAGDKVDVPLVYQVASQPNLPYDTTTVMTTKYTFGYPVFTIEKKYPFRVSAVEKYYWNNNLKSDTVDVVKLKGGKVTVHNGMVSATHSEVVELDSIGQGLVSIAAAKVPYLLTQKDALRTVNMTLERDGSLYEAEPLQAFVLNIYAIKDGTDILSINEPVLVDILRDPPGSGSSATLSKGSTLKYTYSMDMSWAAGLELSIKKGTGLANFYGVVAAPMGGGVVTGVNNEAETSFETSLDLKFSGSGKRAFEYTMTASEDISTNSSGDIVGADGDVYIGVEQNIVVKPAYTIRAIPHKHFLEMGGQLSAGRAIEIAQGVDANDSVYHLVRDESLTYGPTITSTFHHSQQYIISTLIPGLVNQCRSLMFTGSLEEAKAQANKTNKPVYMALVESSDTTRFGVMNMKYGKYYRYTSTMPDEPNMNYRIVVPSDYSEKNLTDEVQQYCAALQAWIGMIAQNEGEKLSATELVSNFVIDGGVGSVEYSEEFSSDYSCMNSMVWPVSGLTDSYFDSTAANGAMTIVQVVGPTVAKFLSSILSTSTGGVNSGTEFGGKVEFVGAIFEFGLSPELSYNVTPEWETSKSFNRKESFSMGLDLKSHLSVDVYRVKTVVTDNMAKGVLDVFTSENFYKQVNYDEEFLKRHLDLNDAQYARGFVYRTRGGATCRPWEDERRTEFYQPGQILDQATKKIENPTIKLDKHSVSGVPMGEPARFSIYLTNETQQPENTYNYFHLYMEEATNPKGAKLMVDGMPLTGTGRVVKVLPGQVTEKTLEVLAADDYDYDGIVIGVCSTEGEKFADSEATFDVHYLRAAGAVNISSPGNKWILNTDAQYDEKFGYFLPIVIDGFNKHQKNFDHIEFQYKESARGEEFWTNLCSYYASDSLYAIANGVKEMIPENGAITTRFFGEKIIMEKAYDLRAVLFCRNGNGYLTTSSPVLSGVKDTRRPQLFGTPKPADGVIDIGDDIIFDFSEDIEYNYLNDTNFEVRGEVNNDYITEDVTLAFSENSSLETSARRNFNAKNITLQVMIKPDSTGVDMPVFSHGMGGKKLQLWFTKDRRLKAVVNNETFTTDAKLKYGTFTPVAMVIKHLSASCDSVCDLRLYNGGNQIGDFQIQQPYTGTGTLIFGRTNETNRTTSKYYKGRMMEARLWYDALSSEQLGGDYGVRRLTGYEKGLVDYYPMNDGDGEYAVDRAQEAHAKLYNATWEVPRGMSLHIDWEDKGIPLSDNFFNRKKYQDYTLMFWFLTSTEGRGTLISNGTGEAVDDGAENQFYIGFDAEKLNFKSNGTVINVPGDYSDIKWHHYAMTVNRSLNLGQIYVDNTLRVTFPVDSLGGISGGFPMLGSTKFERKDDNGNLVADSRNYLRGNLDEICLFDQALPASLIDSYSTKSPHGDEVGLKYYLNFSRQERDEHNQLIQTPYPYSSKIYKSDGQIVYEKDPVTNEPTGIPQRDFPFGNNVTTDMIIKHIDQSHSAPVRPYEELTNISYSYVGKDNQIYFNLNEMDARINKRNIYITVSEIPDKNGNTMASPATAYYFVDCNPLRWGQKNAGITCWSGYEENLYLDITNHGAVRHTYHIENCPRWLSFDKETDVIGARQTMSLTATISKNLNVGTYDEVIYLVDEDGLSEPLGVSITVEGYAPDWYVDSSLKKQTMNMVAQVRINDEVVVDENDIVGVFDDNNLCHGVANIGNGTDNHLVFLNIFDTLPDGETEGTKLSFRLWHHATGAEMLLTPDQTIVFKQSDIKGSVENPVILNGGSQFMQHIALNAGWNWISFNVYGEQFFDINKLLGSYHWKENDILTDNNSDLTFVYQNGGWLSNGDAKSFKLLPQRSYAVKVQDELEITLAGTIIQQKDLRTITLKNGWNGIGYTPMMNLTVTSALEDYLTNGEEGDIIKSHDEFAVYTGPKGNGKWKGSLQYMKPGEGYMFYRHNAKTTSFAYPFYEPGSTFLDEITKAPAYHGLEGKATTMSVSAVTTGVELEPGDCLVAYAEGERRGAVTMAEDSVFYISIEGDVQQPLWFAIERDGDVIATTSEVLTYKANTLVGTPNEPTNIDFTVRDIPKYGWYSLDGLKLPGRPVKKGVYIYNGKKYVID